MEKMPFQPELQRATTMMRDRQPPPRSRPPTGRPALPVLAGSTFTLRELRTEDAPSLLAMLTTEEVARFISPPPTTVEGFERFIAWAQRERAAGNYACFAIVPQGMTTAIGIFQVRSLEPGFGTAEWGFAMGSQFWGTGIFAEGARLVLDFAFDVIGAQPARSARGGGQRPRQRRAAQDRRGAGRRAAPLVPPQRPVSRPGAVGNPGRRLAHAADASGTRCHALTPRSVPERTPGRSLGQTTFRRHSVRPGHFQGCPGLFFGSTVQFDTCCAELRLSAATPSTTVT